MATVAISALPATNTVDATTVAPVVYSGSTYKATLTTLGAFINTNAVTVSATGNITGGNIRTGGVVSATGNVTGNYILGNGALLTGVITSVANINSGTSNVTVVSSGGNVTVGIGGTSNVAVFATTGEYITGVVSASGNVTGGNLNAAGLSLSSNVVSALNSTSDITTTANVSGGNVLSDGAVSATGNITGGNILGGANVNATTHTGTTVSVSGNITGGNLNAAGLSLSSNVVSAINSTSAINTTGNVLGGNLLTGGAISAASVSASGNITGGNLNAAGLSLSGNVVSALNVTGNITGGNLNAAGLSLSSNVVSTLNVTGNIAGGNVRGSSLTGNVVSVSGNITGGNIIGTLIATGFSTAGNITGGNLVTGGAVSAASVSVNGNITAGNIDVVTGNITGGNISLSGNTTPGNVLTGGIVSATGNVTGGNVIGTTAVVVPTVRNTAALTISTSAGNLNLSPTGNVVVNNKYINGVTDPVQDQDVATKKYVDTFASSGIAYHTPVTAATTTTLAAATGGTVTYTQPNGVANGIGALLTTTGSFNLIDTANIQTVGTRILVKNEANAVLNGVYTWANATNIVRSTDTDEYGPDSVTQLSINDYFFTTGGNVNAGAAFIVNSPAGTITFGTSNITFSTFSTSQSYTANTAAGVSLNGTVINAKVDGTTTAFDGLGNIAVKASANLTTPNIGAATGTSLSVTGNITGGNINASKIFNGASQVNVISSGGNISIITGGDPAATFSFSKGLEMLAGNISTAGNVYSGNLIMSANSQIGVGTTTPDSAVSILATGQTVLYPITGNSTAAGTDVHISGSNSAITRITQDAFGTSNYPAFTGRSSRGTSAAPTQSQLNDVLNQFTARGFSNGTLQFGNASTGRLDVVAAENFTDTSRATKLIVYTTPAGAITPVATALFDSTGAFSASGNITGGNVLGGANVNATLFTGTTVSVSGNITGGNVLGGANVNATTHTGTSVSVSGSITGGSLTVSTGNVTLGNIINAGANLTGNIGSATTYFNTVFAKATSAQYADLAEKYTADAEYAPGTVLSFGGSQEVTVTLTDADHRVAGVVSTNPATIMNAGLDSEHVATVALTGRVPCSVTGTVRKGDSMVSAGNGVARAEANPAVSTVIGKALEDFDGESGMIEIVVGRV
jgi:hypothetical protein